MNCIHCGKQLGIRQPKFCSKACACRYRNASRKGVCKTPEKIKAAVELYNSGMLLKDAVKQTGTCETQIRKWAKALGINLRDPKYPQRTKKPYCPNKLIVDAYRKEERIINRLDRLWAYHPEVNTWMNHWRDKRLSCERAKKEYRRNKHRPEYKIKRNLRSRLWFFTTRVGVRRSKTTQSLVGCSQDALRLHLESKFMDGMSWDNYGKWEIDHIKPCTAFDLTNPEEQSKCFHYSNLQPLWKADNIRKGGIKSRYLLFQYNKSGGFAIR